MFNLYHKRLLWKKMSRIEDSRGTRDRFDRDSRERIHNRSARNDGYRDRNSGERGRTRRSRSRDNRGDRFGRDIPYEKGAMRENNDRVSGKDQRNWTTRNNNDTHYGPKFVDENKFPRLPGESFKEFRARARFELPKEKLIWARSPTPPPSRGIKQATAKEDIQPTKTEGKSISKSKVPLKRKRRYSSSSSSSSSSDSSSNSSDSDSDSSSASSSSSSSSSGSSNSKSISSTSSSSSNSSSSSSSSSSGYRRRRKSSKSRNNSKADKVRKNQKTKGGTRDAKRLRTENVTVVPAPVNAVNSFAEASQPFEQPPMTEWEREEALQFKQEVQGDRLRANVNDEDDDDDDFGPKPLMAAKDMIDSKPLNYGGALRPGEGEAIAQFVQQNMRIPRRGEIGWKADEIEALETQGYVMSGSRHKIMNAIRLRKENQVYTAEEKRALAMITLEEQQQKESKVVGDFRMMLSDRLKQAGIQEPSSSSNADEG